MTVGEWLKRTEKLFDRAGISSARLDAQLILSDALNQDRSWLLAHPDHLLNSNFLEKVRKSVERRLEREPIAYIIGEKEFYGRTFMVTPDVLIPRPETEQLVTVALQMINANDMVLDMGTGSGVIAVTLAKEMPGVKITASDISEAALKIAKTNARRHQADIKLVKSDLFKQIEDNFNLIVANLPYVNPTWAVSPEANFEPASAVFASQGGLELIEQLLKRAHDYLAPGGKLVIEADPRQAVRLKALAREQSYGFKSADNFAYVLSR